MPEPTKRTERYGVHSKLSYVLISISVVVLLYIGLRHLNDADEFSRNFSRLVLLEAIFATTGLFFSDLFYLKTFTFYPNKRTARPITLITVIIFISSAFLSEVIQVISRVPATISDAEIALGIIFSAPAEESFFRGFFLSFISWGSEQFKLKKYSLFNYTDRKTGVQFILGVNGVEFVGGFVSALMFAMMHVNYYGDNAMIVSLFFMGLLFSFFFLFSRDLTGLVLGHLLLNIMTVAQWFYFVV